MTTRLQIWEIEVPFRQPLRTAHGSFDARHSVILALSNESATGWAEAPAFPSGRYGTAADAYDDLAEPAGWIGGSPNVPIALAAHQGARADLAARTFRVSLHEHLGASGEPVVARHPIGMGALTDIDQETAWLRTHGIRAVKVKIAPGTDLEPIAALRTAMPSLDIGVDANAGYTDPGDPLFERLDALEVSFIEQPFGGADLAAHATLRGRVRMAVCLDESITSVADVRHAISARAADQIAVKLNRLGLDALAHIRALCRPAGVGIQLGGTFDTAIGRRHLLAASSLSGIVDAAVGPPAAYLAADLAPYPGLVDGMVRPDESPGIGITPDRSTLDDVAIRSTTVTLYD